MAARESVSPIVMGIIVDASASMAENWKNSKGKNLPRIHFIRDSLNAQFQRLSAIYNLKQNKSRKVEVFCLGLGFRIPQRKLNCDSVGNYEPNDPDHSKSVEYIEMVCDILALAEIMPSRTELTEIEAGLNKKWNSYSSRILSQADIQADVYEKLRSLIRDSLYKSVNSHFLGSRRYKLYASMLSSEVYKSNIVLQLPFKLVEKYINFCKERFEGSSNQAATKYFDSIMDHSARIFERHKHKYKQYIADQLEAFVAKQTEAILSALAIGFSVEDVISQFEEGRAQDLAKSIYESLDNDMRRRLFPYWALNKARLWVRKIDINAQMSFKEVDKLTADCVRRFSWERLEPFVKSVVCDLFAKHFKEQALKMVPYWLRLASNREVSKTIGEVFSLFPNIYEENFYSNKYIFGNTPIQDAIDRASLRLLDKKYKNWVKVLILISDGEFANTYPLVAADRLKSKGIKMIACCISSKNITSTLLSRPLERWPDGAKTLFQMSSPINIHDTFEQRIAGAIDDLPQGKQMFLQINQSEILEHLINTVLVDEDLLTENTP